MSSIEMGEAELGFAELRLFDHFQRCRTSYISGAPLSTMMVLRA
jgi:hypothetical protein